MAIETVKTFLRAGNVLALTSWAKAQNISGRNLDSILKAAKEEIEKESHGNRTCTH